MAPRTRLKLLLVVAALGAAPAFAQSPRSIPHFTHVDPLATQNAATRDAFRHALATGRLETLPSWRGGFSIEGSPYHFRFLGGRPSINRTTSIPTTIVPIRLSAPYGSTTVVFDANDIVSHILASPLFSASRSSHNLQFTDTMLRAEFRHARPGWHTILAPSIGPTLDVTAPEGAVKITQAQSGKLFGLIEDSSIVNHAINEFMRRQASADVMTIFITYNSVETFAYGYHSYKLTKGTDQAPVYMYSSWLEGVDDVIGFPSPDAATLSHEIAETVHDPLLTSRTRAWGDAFRDNRCFDTLIEVGDAVEDAPLRLVYARQLGAVDGRPFLFTVQNMALLPWFERQTPSSARDGTYSFPSPRPLRHAAPLDCVK